MKKLSILLLLYMMSLGLQAQTSRWRSYLSYAQPTEIVEASGHIVYVLASKDLYAYNRNDQSIQVYDKINSLNDCGIAHIAWCQTARRLVIVYENHNIDLLSSNGTTVNIADYKDKTLTADKTVYRIDISGPYAYLSTGFGIIKLDVANAAISDTYQLGFRVDYTYLKDSYLYAASSTNGTYRAHTSSNLLDKANWTRVADYTPQSSTLSPDLLKEIEKLSPGGPQYNYFGFMRMLNGSLYTCNGLTGNIEPACIQVLTNGQWNLFPSDGISTSTGQKYESLYCLDIDPRDPQHLMVGGRNGLYEFRNGHFTQFYNSNTTPIQSFDNKDKEYELVTGVKYDPSGNLWLLNSQAPTQSLIAYTADGQWESHSKPELMKLNDKSFSNKSLGDLRDMLLDSRGLIWFVNNHWSTPSLYAYQPSTDALNAYTSFYNEDNTRVEAKYVHCVAEDRDLNIWVGTSAGPLVLPPGQITADSPVFTQVKVPRNDGTDYADYLLSGVDISCIAIDQANRKWFGTYGKGLYLISSDNMGQLQHFTAANSPLFSDNIYSLALDENTGELFIGTDKGLCSYQTNAREAAQGMTRDNVYAYPNPVRPDYTGPIVITGLDEQADVKIVTASGSLVYEAKASGGQVKWYALDRSGRRVASGVYMVLVATKDGDKGVVCKIAVVN